MTLKLFSKAAIASGPAENNHDKKNIFSTLLSFSLFKHEDILKFLIDDLDFSSIFSGYFHNL